MLSERIVEWLKEKEKNQFMAWNNGQKNTSVKNVLMSWKN